MGWYKVVKTIKGHRYVYEQRTWREGKHVRTESRYVWPVCERVATSRPTTASDFDGVVTIPRTFYHGSPDELAGALEPSEEGTFGPGFYLTTQERAALYAQYDAGIAARIAESEEGWERHRKYDGPVYAFDVSELKFKAVKHERYQRLCMALDPLEAPTPSAKAKLMDILVAEGYDGLYILDQQRHEMVIFSDLASQVKISRHLTLQTYFFTPAIVWPYTLRIRPCFPSNTTQPLAKYVWLYKLVLLRPGSAITRRPSIRSTGTTGACG